MVNSWVILLIQWLGWIGDIEAVGFLLVRSCISHQLDLQMLGRCELVDYILQLCNESSGKGNNKLYVHI
jgi:hypothetical protein